MKMKVNFKIILRRYSLLTAAFFWKKICYQNKIEQ